jgi:DNA-binding beta-propeller fold protein YncE
VVAGAGVQPFMPPNMLDGAIEAIDAMTLRPVGMRVTEMALGGDLQGLVMLDENRGWALVYRFTMGAMREARVVAFDLATGTVGATVFTAASIGAIARDPAGNVWVLDRSSGVAGARVFRADGTQLTSAPITTGLPPYGVAFVP